MPRFERIIIPLKVTKLLISNAFSLNMLPAGQGGNLLVTPVDNPRELVSEGVQSIVGHQSTAEIFSNILGVKIEFNRTSHRLSAGEKLLVGQYSGPRLEEGATLLPEGARITWLLLQWR